MNIFDLKTWTKQLKFNIKRAFNVYHYPHVHPNSRIGLNDIVKNPNNLYLDESSTLKRDDVIMNARARFIMKKWSGSAEELMVITGNHMSIVGKNVKEVTNKVKDVEDTHNEYDRDVIVDEDVWIGARVTVLQGVHIGRGCEIGAGTVLRSSTPPYSIVIGNPAKVIGFRFTPDEIIEHEKILYPEEERLPLELLRKNYEKYFLKRIKEIKKYVQL